MPFWMRCVAAFHFQHSTFCQAAVVWPQPTFGPFGCKPLVPRCPLSGLHTAPHPRRASAAGPCCYSRDTAPPPFPPAASVPLGRARLPPLWGCSALAGSGCGGAAVLPPGVSPGCGGTLGCPPASLRGWVDGKTLSVLSAEACEWRR